MKEIFIKANYQIVESEPGDFWDLVATSLDYHGEVTDFLAATLGSDDSESYNDAATDGYDYALLTIAGASYAKPKDFEKTILVGSEPQRIWGSIFVDDDFNIPANEIIQDAITPIADDVLQPKLLLTYDSKKGNHFYGENNIDTIIYGGWSAETASFKKTGDETWNVSLTSKSLDGSYVTSTHTLHGIERIQLFDNTKVALDVTSPTQSAGAAVALWYAYYDQLPSGFDLGSWIAKADQIHDSPVFDQNDLEELAQSMLTSFSNSGSKDGSGSKNSGISNTDLVTRLYTNIVGTAPSSDDLNYFTQLIETGAYTQAGLFAFAAAHELNTEQYADLVGNGLQYVSKGG